MIWYRIFQEDNIPYKGGKSMRNQQEKWHNSEYMKNMLESFSYEIFSYINVGFDIVGIGNFFFFVT